MCTARATHARCITPCTLHHAVHALSALRHAMHVLGTLRHAMHVPSAQRHGRGALCGQVERQGPAGDADRRSVGLAGHTHAAYAHGTLGAALLAAEPGLLRPVLHLGLVVTTPLYAALKYGPQGNRRAVQVFALLQQVLKSTCSDRAQLQGGASRPRARLKMVFVCSMINVSRALYGLS